MLLDTSALIEYLRRSPDEPLGKKLRELTASQRIFASPIHLGELADAARRAGLPVQETVDRALGAVELVPLDASIAVQASAIKAEARTRRSGKGFSLIDGIGLASARSRGLRLVTLDREFSGFPDAIVLDA